MGKLVRQSGGVYKDSATGKIYKGISASQLPILQARIDKQSKARAAAAPGQPAAAPAVAPDIGEEGLGNTGVSADNFLESVFSNIGDLDLSGQPKILTDNDLAATRDSAYNSLYSKATENLERNRNRDLEAAKQEAAMRGIPFDPANPESAYGKSIGAVNEQYRQYERQAMDDANLGADARLSTLVGANATAADQFTKSAIAKYGAKLDAAAAATNALGVLMERYKISREEAQRMLDRKHAEKIAKMQAANNLAVARARGAGGGGGAAAVDEGADEFR